MPNARSGGKGESAHLGRTNPHRPSAGARGSEPKPNRWGPRRRQERAWLKNQEVG
jgi:hypothetical protein